MIRIRRWALLSAVAGTSLTLSACNRDGFGESTLPGPNPVATEKVDIGQALFKKEPAGTTQPPPPPPKEAGPQKGPLNSSLGLTS